MNAKVRGLRLGGDTQKVIRTVKAGEWQQAAARASWSWTPRSPKSWLPKGWLPKGWPRMWCGWCRAGPSEAGLDASDRIAVTLDGPADALDAVWTHQELVPAKCWPRLCPSAR
ncbi:MAG: hypothetical protein M3Z25_17255 [Actinomycetota bacterium]|nr:hypothetical protein [Actinomycetota bacterium]